MPFASRRRAPIAILARLFPSRTESNLVEACLSERQAEQQTQRRVVLRLASPHPAYDVVAEALRHQLLQLPVGPGQVEVLQVGCLPLQALHQAQA